MFQWSTLLLACGGPTQECRDVLVIVPWSSPQTSESEGLQGYPAPLCVREGKVNPLSKLELVDLSH